MRRFLLVLLLCVAPVIAADRPARPNIVFILIDDMGYADPACFGSKINRTPHIDRMAAEGMKLTSWYTAPVCSPSRSSIMTGCYAPRTGFDRVLFPGDRMAMSPREITVAQMLRDKGYDTMAVGKWHLGDQPGTLPTDRGFNHYLGIPYSNDMGPVAEGSRSNLGDPVKEDPLKAAGKAPEKKAKGKNKAKTDQPAKKTGPDHPPLPLIRDGKVIQRVKAAEQQHFTRTYTQEAVKYIAEHKQGPFFLYLAHNAVHFPIYPHPEFAGKNPNGIYSDWVEEVDWSVGQVMQAIRDAGIEKNTLVIFTSDNGGTPRAVNFPLRGFKASTWEGGVRDPAIAWWPGRIKAGSSNDSIMGNIDFLPTAAGLVGAAVPSDRVIDGRDIWPVLSGQSAQGPHDTWHYFRGSTLEAVRHGDWKYFLDGAQKGQLYNLKTDIGESTDVAAGNPQVIAELAAIAQKMHADLGKKMDGPGFRPPAMFDDPKPFIAKDGSIRADGK